MSRADKKSVFDASDGRNFWLTERSNSF